MLKGLDPLLTPELLMHLSAMGHGEWVAVVDANFTADHLAQGRIPVVRLPGHSLVRVAQAVLSVLPLAADVAQPLRYMQVCAQPEGHRTAAQQALVDLAGAHGVALDRVQATARHAFYDHVRQASLLVQSGEHTAYGNALMCKGVILNAQAA